MNVPVITFHDALGKLLAKAFVPVDSFEGETGTVKNFDVDCAIMADGRLDHYICVSPDGTTLKGKIIEKRGNHARELFLDKVEFKRGESLKGISQIEITRD